MNIAVAKCSNKSGVLYMSVNQRGTGQIEVRDFLANPWCVFDAFGLLASIGEIAERCAGLSRLQIDTQCF